MLKLIVAAILLISGLANYWLFRSDIYFFELMHFTNSDPLSISNNVQLNFFKNYYADIVWVVAIFLIATLLREKQYPRVYSNILILLPFISELCQLTGVIPGTFDWLDLSIYLVIFVLFFHMEAFHMQNAKNHFVGVSAIIIFTAALFASSAPPSVPIVYETGTFKLPKKQNDFFTKPSLATIMRKSKTFSIVLRVPSSGEKITQEERQQNNLLYNHIEKEFSKAGFIVRDRALFAKVLEQETLDYSKIGKVTETDFILELVSFKNINYKVREYKDENGVEKTSAREFNFTGSMVEFKLISVEQNDLVGSYTFHFTPCTDGCTHRFSVSRTATYEIPANIPEEFFSDSAKSLIKEIRMLK